MVTLTFQTLQIISILPIKLTKHANWHDNSAFYVSFPYFHLHLIHMFRA
jgi:hypothetical protein